MLRSVVAAAFTVVTSALLLIEFASMTVDGATSPALLARGPCTVAIVSLASEGTGGLRAGDEISMPSLDRSARIYLETGSARADAKLRIPVVRGGRSITVQSQAGAPSWTFWLLGLIVKLVIFVVGLFVLWRGRDAAAFFFGVSSLAIAVVIDPSPSSIFAIEAQAAAYVWIPVFAEIAALCFYLMIEELSRPFVPRSVIIGTRAVAFTGLALAVADNIMTPTSRMQTGCVNAFLATAHPLSYMAALLATLVLLTLGFVRAAGQSRQRMRWIVVSTIVGFSGVLIYLTAQLLGHPIPAYPIVNITAVAIPLGYAYAIMRHRVIDVGFAINRAIVFTAMTSVVVAAFALLSSALERAAVGQSTGLALQVGVALVLALSFNALEKRVEWAIDRLFFRKKHRAEAELAQLADEVPFIHSADVLLERVAGTVRRELGAAGVAVYHALAGHDYDRVQADGGQFPDSVPIDDPAFVRLRTYVRDVDLTDIESALGNAGSAFPLAVQGRLSGALVCRPRASEEPYDPDERASVRALAARVATALEALHARELAHLVKALAEGSLDVDAARARAKALIDEA